MRVECQICGATYLDAAGLWWHVWWMHRKIDAGTVSYKMTICPWCNERVPRSGGIDEHHQACSKRLLAKIAGG